MFLKKGFYGLLAQIGDRINGEYRTLILDKGQILPPRLPAHPAREIGPRQQPVDKFLKGLDLDLPLKLIKLRRPLLRNRQLGRLLSNKLKIKSLLVVVGQFQSAEDY